MVEKWGVGGEGWKYIFKVLHRCAILAGTKARKQCCWTVITHWAKTTTASILDSFLCLWDIDILTHVRHCWDASRALTFGFFWSELYLQFSSCFFLKNQISNQHWRLDTWKKKLQSFLKEAMTCDLVSAVPLYTVYGPRTKQLESLKQGQYFLLSVFSTCQT